MIRRMPRFFALGLLAIGLVMIVVALRQSARGRETRGWTRTEGRVLASRVAPVADESEDHLDRTGFVIRYEYTVGGRRYESSQVFVGSSAVAEEDPRGPRRWVERFPEGAPVPVWFDPRDPGQAVLVRGLPDRRRAHVAFVAGAVLAAVAFFSLARGGR